MNKGYSLAQLLIIMLMSSLLASPSRAADVTYATDAYTSGDTLTAADLNAKFNNIKSGVNDNNAKADTNTTAIDTLSTRLTANTAGAGATTGDMQYWNGSAWVLVSAPATNTTSLHFCNGKPTWEACTYAIGDTGPAGGIVFHITDGGLHGLETTTADQTSTKWGCSGTLLTHANNTLVGAGAHNTSAIISSCNEVTAASVAASVGLGWFLPSKNELILLHAQKVSGVVGGFASPVYWSSSQTANSDLDAWALAFNNLYNTGGVNDRTLPWGVRAVRAF